MAGSDASVVKRTQAARAALLQQPAAHYAAYFTVARRTTLLLLGIVGILLKVRMPPSHFVNANCVLMAFEEEAMGIGMMKQ